MHVVQCSDLTWIIINTVEIQQGNMENTMHADVMLNDIDKRKRYIIVVCAIYVNEIC